MSAPETLDMYVAFGQRRGNDTLHWIFVLAPPNSNRCTWYHIKGGPTQGRPYKMMVEDNKRMDSFGIASLTKICTIPASQRRRVLAQANAIPLQRCQRWTTELLSRLETKGLAPPGTGARFAAMIEPSRFEGGSGRGSGTGSGSVSSSGSASRLARTSGGGSGGGSGSGSVSRVSGSLGSGSMTSGSGIYPPRGSGSSRESGSTSSWSWSGRRR
ncbi:hypothetical protein BDW69DRAFT_81818 [Aspergillus filifer]